MALINLYIDATNNSLIGGFNTEQNVDPSSLPLYFGDTLQLRVYQFNRLQTVSPGTFPFEIISTAGIQFFLYLDDGKVDGTIYTQQISWQTDAANTYFYANLALNTAALETLIGTSPGATVTIQAGYVQDGLQTTTLSRAANILVGLPQTTLIVPPGLTPLSAEVANATYFPQQPVPGMPLYLASPAGKIFMWQAVDNPDATANVLGPTQIN